jgi:SAM-dependent methyltransferase
MSRVQRLVRTVERSLKKRGVVGSVVHFGVTAAERIGKRGQPATAPADAAEDQEFDARYGVSTGGEIPQTELDVKDPTWIHGSAYVPTSPVDFAEVLGPLGLTYEETTFIDLGSGKGRVLLMAAALPFRRIVGVEFSAKLADVARENVQRYTGPKKCSDLTVETMDATKYRLPDGPLVVFMYHPFDEKIMAAVAESVTASLRERPRRILIVYFKPVHREVWDGASAFEKRREEKLYVIYESRLT